MDAVPILGWKLSLEDDLLLEVVVWQVPEPVPGSAHGYKYRLFFGRSGKRIVGYDNERGKGDHKHLSGRQHPYQFTNVDTLIDDFLADIQRWRTLQK